MIVGKLFALRLVYHTYDTDMRNVHRMFITHIGIPKHEKHVTTS